MPLYPDAQSQMDVMGTGIGRVLRRERAGSEMEPYWDKYGMTVSTPLSFQTLKKTIKTTHSFTEILRKQMKTSCPFGVLNHVIPKGKPVLAPTSSPHTARSQPALLELGFSDLDWALSLV